MSGNIVAMSNDIQNNDKPKLKMTDAEIEAALQRMMQKPELPPEKRHREGFVVVKALREGIQHMHLLGYEWEEIAAEMVNPLLADKDKTKPQTIRKYSERVQREASGAVMKAKRRSARPTSPVVPISPVPDALTAKTPSEPSEVNVAAVL